MKIGIYSITYRGVWYDSEPMGLMETMISYVRDCIRLTHDLGAPICKIFAAWRGITLYDELGTYNDAYGHSPYPYWKGDRRNFVVDSIAELSKLAEDYGILPSRPCRRQARGNRIRSQTHPARTGLYESPERIRRIEGAQPGVVHLFVHEMW